MCTGHKYFYDFERKIYIVSLSNSLEGCDFNVRMMACEQTNKQTSTAMCCHIRTQTLNETRSE